jgi:hypothetical protein
MPYYAVQSGRLSGAHYDAGQLVPDGIVTPSMIAANLVAGFAGEDPGLGGGAGVAAQTLAAWATGEAFELTAVTRDSNDVVTSATVKWPDGSGGLFTATAVNATWHLVDAYTITHTASGMTVTQAAMTRNSTGAVTAKPALTVA